MGKNIISQICLNSKRDKLKSGIKRVRISLKLPLASAQKFGVKMRIGELWVELKVGGEVKKGFMLTELSFPFCQIKSKLWLLSKLD